MFGGMFGHMPSDGSPSTESKPCTSKRWNGKGCDGTMIPEEMPPKDKGGEKLKKWTCNKCGRIEI